MDYVLLKQLGGLRHSKADSPNMGWRNLSFRGFADYMQTQEFAESIDQLVGLAQNCSGCHHVCGGSSVAMPSVVDR